MRFRYRNSNQNVFLYGLVQVLCLLTIAFCGYQSGMYHIVVFTGLFMVLLCSGYMLQWLAQYPQLQLAVEILSWMVCIIGCFYYIIEKSYLFAIMFAVMGILIFVDKFLVQRDRR